MQKRWRGFKKPTYLYDSSEKWLITENMLYLPSLQRCTKVLLRREKKENLGKWDGTLHN